MFFVVTRSSLIEGYAICLWLALDKRELTQKKSQCLQKGRTLFPSLTLSSLTKNSFSHVRPLKIYLSETTFKLQLLLPLQSKFTRPTFKVYTQVRKKSSWPLANRPKTIQQKSKKKLSFDYLWAGGGAGCCRFFLTHNSQNYSFVKWIGEGNKTVLFEHFFMLQQKIVQTCVK